MGRTQIWDGHDLNIVRIWFQAPQATGDLDAIAARLEKINQPLGNRKDLIIFHCYHSPLAQVA
jgi:hypothetical protein